MRHNGYQGSKEMRRPADPAGKPADSPLGNLSRPNRIFRDVGRCDRSFDIGTGHS